MNLVIGKEHTAARGICAVVFDRDQRNKILFRSYAGFNKRGKAECQRWLDEEYEPWLRKAGWK